METKEICEKIIKKHNGTFLKGKRIASTAGIILYPVRSHLITIRFWKFNSEHQHFKPVKLCRKLVVCKLIHENIG